MRKKNVRDVRFVCIRFKQKLAGSKDDPKEIITIRKKDALAYCLDILKNKLDENYTNLLAASDNNTIFRAIRRLESSADNSYRTLLWAMGDQKLADPCFWNHNDDSSRSEKPKEDESVACSCHLVIHSHRIPRLGGYIACLEEATQLGPAALENCFNKFLRDYIKETIEITGDGEKPGKKIRCIISVSIDTLATRSLPEMLKGNRPLAIMAEKIEPNVKAFDESMDSYKTSRLTLKVKSQLTIGSFINAFKSLVSGKQKYDWYTICYRQEHVGERQLKINASELTKADDVETLIFAYREKLATKNAIPQFCQEIHKELTEIMMYRISKEITPNDTQQKGI